MKGKIIKIDADKILIRPAENFLDVNVGRIFGMVLL